eukprot:CAMPEP_0170496248 /NCGR_PEP_ID=MMETSP0208-20121228/20780_1 /TAXON_ID=197538 /ORGANISM="Strombidium inclinatum, Strain S3" /LENGTH=50 /DNA_ID=CAMNT_0010772745 /DNA_START=3304 /DNA_END=3457 /DNA_ORIENTATION=-
MAPTSFKTKQQLRTNQSHEEGADQEYPGVSHLVAAWAQKVRKQAQEEEAD